MRFLAFLFTISVLMSDAFAQDLTDSTAITAKGDRICGAGNALLTAFSSIDDANLQFEWFRENVDGTWVSLGILDGSDGQSEFVTPFLIASEFFAVRVVLGTQTSSLLTVHAQVVNQADIRQRSEIQLCGEVFLEATTNIPEDSIESYQWQVLVPNAEGEAFFENLNTDDSDSVVLTTNLAGFYRVIVTDSAGCQGISAEVEVTDEEVMFVAIRGAGVHCFFPGDPATHSLSLRSEYGRAFTKYLWEESLDGITFIPLSNEQRVVINKPPSVVSDDTTYYKLTLTEQNCSVTGVGAVYWSVFPTGTIEHTNASIGTSDFFYCNTDDPSLRTLRATSFSPRVKVTWLRSLFHRSIPLEAVKRSSGPNPDLSGLIFSEIGEGEEITLTQLQGGLVVAQFTDTVTQCASFSDHAIFSDTAFPFPIRGTALAYDTIQVVCKGDEIVFDSYDRSADTYSWQRRTSTGYEEIGTEISLILDSGADDIAGDYRLEVTKNGCSGASPDFTVHELSLPGAEITSSVNTEVNICGGADHVFLLADPVAEAAYQWLYSPVESNDLSDYIEAGGADSLRFYQASIPGFYRVQVTTDCSAISDPVQVTVDPSSGLDFQVGIDGDSLLCQGALIELSSTYKSESAEYFWVYRPVDSLEFIFLEDEEDSVLAINAALFGIDVNQTIEVDIHVAVADGFCGALSQPFRMRLAPGPVIQIRNSLENNTDDVLYCSDEELGFNLEVVQLNTTKVADLRYQWERFSPDSLAFQEIENAEAALFTPNGPGRYRCRTVSGGFCEVISSTIDVLTPPSAILGDTVYCEGTAINLHIDQGFLPDLGAFSIDWFYSEDGQSFERINRTIQDSLFIPESSPLYRSGYYFYEASKESCVKTSDTLRVTKNEDSFSTTLFGVSKQTRGVPFQFSINTDDSEQVFGYQWSPEEFLDFTDGSRGIFTVPESFETDSILVSVQVTSEGGCSLNRSLTVFLNEVGELLFPKFISPNGDGLNDLFIITGIDEQKENDLRIIDGWGNTLYRFKNFYNQEAQAKRLAERIRNEGVYYYLFEEAGEKIRKGSFYVRGQ